MSVARLQLGQRVCVLRDTDGVEIGAWGDVARECFRSALAWVRLDERHARCPFPADLENRATWLLTLPEHCSSFAPLELVEDRTPEQLAADGDLEPGAG